MSTIKFDKDAMKAKIAAGVQAKREAALGITPATETVDENAPVEHYLTRKVHVILEQRIPCYLVGPAGSGKSKMVELAAQRLNLPFHCPPIGRETTNSQLFGYMNAQGEYVRTPIREAVEHGGVIHLEEIDFASPAVGTALNAMLANDFIGFPDCVIRKHADCIIVASANTFGTGANRKYIGSQGLNAATLDRFAFIEIPYDEKMERRIAPNPKWTTYVQRVRHIVEKLGLNHVVSPRASINGGKLVDAKTFTLKEIERMVLFKGLDEITIGKIKTMVNTDPFQK